MDCEQKQARAIWLRSGISAFLHQLLSHCKMPFTAFVARSITSRSSKSLQISRTKPNERATVVQKRTNTPDTQMRRMTKRTTGLRPFLLCTFTLSLAQTSIVAHVSSSRKTFYFSFSGGPCGCVEPYRGAAPVRGKVVAAGWAEAGGPAGAAPGACASVEGRGSHPPSWPGRTGGTAGHPCSPRCAGCTCQRERARQCHAQRSLCVINRSDTIDPFASSESDNVFARTSHRRTGGERSLAAWR